MGLEINFDQIKKDGYEIIGNELILHDKLSNFYSFRLKITSSHLFHKTSKEKALDVLKKDIRNLNMRIQFSPFKKIEFMYPQYIVLNQQKNIPEVVDFCDFPNQTIGEL